MNNNAVEKNHLFSKKATMTLAQLRNGPLVREDAILLALRLEDAGHALTVRDGVLSVTNGSRLSAEDRARIGACKAHLCALVGYCQEGHGPR